MSNRARLKFGLRAAGTIAVLVTLLVVSWSWEGTACVTCQPASSVNHELDCEKDRNTACTWDSCATAKKAAPVLYLKRADVRVNDTPIWFDESVGPDFSFDMHFDRFVDRSQTGETWAVGYKWSYSYGNYVDHVGSDYLFNVGNDRYYKFVPDGQGGYKEELGPGVNAKGGQYAIEVAGSNVTIHVREGGRYEFEPDGSGSRYRLSGVFDRFGDKLAVNYTSNRVSSVVTASGRTFDFLYSGSGYITNISDITGGRCASFAYTNDYLVEVRDVGGTTFQYGYDTNGITSLARPGIAGCDTTTVSYSSSGGCCQDQVTIADGLPPSNFWGGVVGSTMDLYNGFGGVTRSLPDPDYSWGAPDTEVTDARTGLTTYIYYDYTGYAAIDGKVREIVTPDDVIAKFTYNTFGDIASVTRRDKNLNIIQTLTNTYTFFDGTWAPATVQSEIRDAQGNVLSKSLAAYSRDDRGTTNTWDDVYLPVSAKTWLGSNSTDYAELQYTYTTNFLIETVRELVGPGTNDFRLVVSNSYDSLRRLVSSTDAISNTLHYAYNEFNLVTNVTRYLSRGDTSIALALAYRHDSLDRITNIVHPDGLQESWVYAPWGGNEVVAYTDRGGNLTTNLYDSHHWLVESSTTTTNGTVLFHRQYAYNQVGTLTNTTDALNHRQESLYTSAGDLWKSVDELNRTTEYRYDSAGRTASTTFPDGTVVSNTYDSAGRLVKISTFATATSAVPLAVSEFTHDALGRVKTAKDPVGNVTTYTYDFLGRPVRTTRADGSFSETVYDRAGNPVLNIGPVPAGANQEQQIAATTSNSFDVLNRLVSVTDPENRAVRWEYDADYPARVKYLRNDNNQAVVENAYDAFTGRLLTNTVYGVKRSYSYDALDQVTRVDYPDGSYESVVFDGWRPLSARSRTGNVSSSGFDALGRLTAYTNALGNATLYSYDAFGNLTGVTDPLAQTRTWAYNPMNQPTALGLLDGRVATNSYDSLGRQVSRTGAGGLPVSFDYDAADRLTALTDGRGNQTTYDYSAVHDLIRKVHADSSFQAYTNNARGWLVGRTDPNGKTTSYQYNNAGQLTGIDYPTDTDVELSYDNLGRMTSRVDQAGTWTWSYDGESSRILSETLTPPSLPSLPSVQYSYHSNTLDLASVSFGSYTTLYTWAAGRLTNVSLVSSVLSGGQFSYSYLPNSDLLSGMSNAVFQITRAYDPLDRLTNLSSFVPSVPFVANSFSYSLDSVGRRTARQDADGSQLAWKYDFYDQLTNAARSGSANGAADASYNFGYQYDQGGNRLHEDRGQMDLDGSFNNLNQITTLNWAGKLDVVGSVGATGVIVKVRGTNAVLHNLTNFLGGATLKAGSNNIPIVAWLGTNATEMNRTVYMPPIKPQVFLWDPNGNLTNDGQRAYFWDEENRLTQIETTASATNMGIPKRKSVYVYDAQSRRTQKTDYSAWNGAAYATTNVTRFVWDGWLLISETQVSGLTSQVFFYVWGQDLSQSLQGAGGIGGLLCVIRNGTPYYPLSDANGSVSDYLDATGAVVAHREYDPFGRTLVSSGPMKDAFTFWFSTKYHESFWNLCYFGYRWYSPNLGIFLSNDPLGEQADLNMIRFCRNNPIDLVDPLGLTTLEEAQASLAEAVRKLKRYGRLAGNYATMESELFGNSDVIFMSNAEGGLTKVRRGTSEAETYVLLAAAMRYGAENVLPPEFTAFGTKLSSDQAGLAVADMRRLYEHAGFLEWAGKLPSGSISPECNPFFDTDSPEFNASRRRAIGIMINPSAGIARHLVHGDYGDAALEYGKQAAIAGAFAVGGELVGTGRIGFRTGFGAAKSEGAVFWSGRAGANRAAAEAFAEQSGGTTLEMSSAGRALEQQGVTFAQNPEAWINASRNFAAQASGEVNAFAGGARVNSIWKTVELPTLMQNNSVTKIIIQDATRPEVTRIIYPPRVR